MRYEILVKRGQKIVERHRRKDYDDAMQLLYILEENMADAYTVEFRDTNPFAQ